MKTINAINVNYAWAQAINLMRHYGLAEVSRNGPVRVAPWPVTTIYSRPDQRVLLDPVRDANPIFHLHEALWMLAGRNDATWLDQFVGDFSARYAEPDGTLHGAYGYRWREHFIDRHNINRAGNLDQLNKVVKILVDDPYSRQAVIQMWDAEMDLGVPGLKDRPCNTQIYLRIRITPNTAGISASGLAVQADLRELDMCITCRSNDIVWGAYGANVVHFSILQEYLAARLGVTVGKLTQFSWNWHMYHNTHHLADQGSADRHADRQYPGTLPLVTDPANIDFDIEQYVENPETGRYATNTFLGTTAYPMFMANIERKAGNLETSAMSWANEIQAPDWREATVAWLQRRIKA